MKQSPYSGRDQYYINSTSFEVYMIVGTIFVLGFTMAFIGSVLMHMEVLLWPGALVSAGLAYWVLRVLSRRERLAKMREIDNETR
jgi:hypothetical protein